MATKKTGWPSGCQKAQLPAGASPQPAGCCAFFRAIRWRHSSSGVSLSFCATLRVASYRQHHPVSMRPAKKLAPPRAPVFLSNSTTPATSPALQICTSTPHAPFPSGLLCRFGGLRSEAFLRPMEATSLESLPNWARTWFLTLLTRSWRSFWRARVSSRAAA